MPCCKTAGLTAIVSSPRELHETCSRPCKKNGKEISLSPALGQICQFTSGLPVQTALFIYVL